MSPTTAAILVSLSALCTVYAITLNRLQERYVPDWVWLTVVVGNSFIVGALWAVEAFSEPLRVWHVMAAMVAAGGPIIVWQLWQHERRRRNRQTSRRSRHAAAHEGRRASAPDDR